MKRKHPGIWGSVLALPLVSSDHQGIICWLFLLAAVHCRGRASPALRLLSAPEVQCYTAEICIGLSQEKTDMSNPSAERSQVWDKLVPRTWWAHTQMLSTALYRWESHCCNRVHSRMRLPAQEVRGSAGQPYPRGWMGAETVLPHVASPAGFRLKCVRRAWRNLLPLWPCCT